MPLALLAIVAIGAIVMLQPKPGGHAPGPAPKPGQFEKYHVKATLAGQGMQGMPPSVFAPFIMIFLNADAAGNPRSTQWFVDNVTASGNNGVEFDATGLPGQGPALRALLAPSEFATAATVTDVGPTNKIGGP